MKNIMRSNIYLPMAAMILTAALAVPAAAQKQVPFKGAMQGHDTDTGSTNTTVTVLTVGTGIGTHLGQFSFTQTVTVDLTTGHDTGSAQWFAANRDSISTTITGSGQVIDPMSNQHRGGSHHYRWNGSIRGSTRELYREAPGKRGNVFDLRLIRRDHYSPGCSSLRTVNTRAEKRCRVEVSDAP